MACRAWWTAHCMPSGLCQVSVDGRGKQTAGPGRRCVAKGFFVCWLRAGYYAVHVRAYVCRQTGCACWLCRACLPQGCRCSVWCAEGVRHRLCDHAHSVSVSPGCLGALQARQLPWQPAVGCGAWCRPPATCCAVLWWRSWLWQQTTTGWERTWPRAGSLQVRGPASCGSGVRGMGWSRTTGCAVVGAHCIGAAAVALVCAFVSGPILPDHHHVAPPRQLCAYACCPPGACAADCCTHMQAKQWKQPGVHATRQQHSDWRCFAATCPPTRPSRLWCSWPVTAA